MRLCEDDLVDDGEWIIRNNRVRVENFRIWDCQTLRQVEVYKLLLK
jgi:hypothetical protein